MINRGLLSTLRLDLTESPCVVLLGPRQVGKTTLAKKLVAERAESATYLDLESPRDLSKLADAESYLEARVDHLIVLDEVQRMPGLFAILRGIIDRYRAAGRRTGHFLLLGSASRALLAQSSESLAGRAVYRELCGLQPSEVGEEGTLNLWLRGGFPESFFGASENRSLKWRNDFISTYLERDIPGLGVRVAATTLRRFWTMLAHQQGSMLNQSTLAMGLGVSGKTIAHYVDIYTDLLLARRLLPWSANVGKRLVRSPKIYLRDSGLVHSLLNIADHDALLGHPIVGMSYEGFVIESLINAVGDGATAWFYRTTVGAEIDLLLEFPSNEKWAIEIKLSTAPKVSRGFHVACDDLQVSRRILVYPGSDAWRMNEHIEVTPFADLLNELHQHRR
jgi:uncharacterized protein